MVVKETILLGNQYVQYVSVALYLAPKDTTAEWVHGKYWKGKKEKLEILTSVKAILENFSQFLGSWNKIKQMNGFTWFLCKLNRMGCIFQ